METPSSWEMCVNEGLEGLPEEVSGTIIQRVDPLDAAVLTLVITDQENGNIQVENFLADAVASMQKEHHTRLITAARKDLAHIYGALKTHREYALTKAVNVIDMKPAFACKQDMFLPIVYNGKRRRAFVCSS
jgi:hypothetical protein